MRLFNVDRIARDWIKLTELGPRFFGTAGEANASDYIRESLLQVPCEVNVRPYSCLGWRLATRPRLTVVQPEMVELPCHAFIRCASTGKEGIRGRLRYVGIHQVIGLYRWEKYGVVDPVRGLVAYVSGRPDGKPQPQPLSEWSSFIPHFAIGSTELKVIQEWIGRGTPVWVEGWIDCQLDQQDQAANIVVSIPGELGPKKKIVVCAHFDSVYSCPGANDNAGGVAVLLEFARYYSRHPLPDCALELVFFDGEEWNLDGSRAYVAELLQRGEAGLIKAVVNLDGIAETGREIQLWVGPEELEWQVLNWVETFQEHSGPRAYSVFPPPAGSDHWHFWQHGIPVVMITGMEMEKYHLEADICSEEGVSNLGHVAGLTADLIERIAAWENRSRRAEISD